MDTKDILGLTMEKMSSLMDNINGIENFGAV